MNSIWPSLKGPIAKQVRKISKHVMSNVKGQVLRKVTWEITWDHLGRKAHTSWEFKISSVFPKCILEGQKWKRR